MTDTITRRLLSIYNQDAPDTMFLSSFFRSPPENFYSTEEFEIDIVRTEEDVSVVITDLTTGYRMNSQDLYTSKRFIAPVHKEAIALNSFQLLERVPGNDSFQSPNFRANILEMFLKGMRKIDRMIRRSNELQAAQIFQTGVLNLVNSSGEVLFNIDFKPKATHFPTAPEVWGTTNADMISDLIALDDELRSNGLRDPDTKLMGQLAFEALLQDPKITPRLDLQRLDKGKISRRQIERNGGIYHGVIELGNYRSDIWTYNGRYKDPQTGVSKPYLSPGNVVSLSSDGRFDATFGFVPNIGRELNISGNVLSIPELPSRISDSDRGMDFFMNAWISPDGEQLFGGLASRPLFVPTAIDQFGCLDTGLNP